jgi:hypothetical protein
MNSSATTATGGRSKTIARISGQAFAAQML